MEENGGNSWFKVLLGVLIVVTGFALFFSLFGSGKMGNSMGGGMMGFGWGFMVFFLILILIFIFASIDKDEEGRCHGEDGQQILERRYANGEISRSEYLKIKDDLKWKNSKEMR